MTEINKGRLVTIDKNPPYLQQKEAVKMFFVSYLTSQWHSLRLNVSCVFAPLFRFVDLPQTRWHIQNFWVFCSGLHQL